MGVELDLHKYCYVCAIREIVIVLRSRKTDNDTPPTDKGDGNTVPVPEMPPIGTLSSFRDVDEDTITEASLRQKLPPLPPPLPAQVVQGPTIERL